MPTDVVMPQMGESITEGTLTKWLKKVGDTVQRDEPLFEISTDKVDAEIPSPAAGMLQEIKIAEGSTVQINTVVAVIARGRAVRRQHRPSPPRAPAEDSVTPAAVDRPPTNEAAPAGARGPGAGTEVLMPQMGESITEGTITKWLKKVGDTVQRDEPIFEISTDKVDAEIPSPVAGTLSEIKVPEGSTVSINTVVAVIGGAAGKPAAAPAPAAGCTGCQSASGCERLAPAAAAAAARASAALFAAGAQDRQGQQRRPHARFPERARRGGSRRPIFSAIWRSRRPRLQLRAPARIRARCRPSPPRLLRCPASWCR